MNVVIMYEILVFVDNIFPTYLSLPLKLEEVALLLTNLMRRKTLPRCDFLGQQPTRGVWAPDADVEILKINA